MKGYDRSCQNYVVRRTSACQRQISHPEMNGKHHPPLPPSQTLRRSSRCGGVRWRGDGLIEKFGAFNIYVGSRSDPVQRPFRLGQNQFALTAPQMGRYA